MRNLVVLPIALVFLNSCSVFEEESKEDSKTENQEASNPADSDNKNGADVSYTGNVIHLNTEEDLPKCESKNVGFVYFVANTSKFLVCDQVGEYQVVDLKGTKGDQGEKGDSGPKGDKGETGDSGLASLIKTAVAPKGESCAHGGIKVESGFDLDGNGSLSSAEVTQTNFVCSPGACPVNWVLVPAYNDSSRFVPAFCVMKYEAKKDASNKAISKASDQPWLQISRGAGPTVNGGAWKACRDLGSQYDLISNSQWQSIALQIEAAELLAGERVNWSNGTTAADSLINMGHSDQVPNRTLAASADDNPCFDTGNSSCQDSTHADFSQKRTHTLPNGEVIWDIAGNAQEWTKDDSSYDYGVEDYWSQISASSGVACATPACAGPQGLPKGAFGPRGDYSFKTTGFRGGLGYAWAGNTGDSVIRGGGYSYGGGVFTVDLTEPITMSILATGFRCVTVPEF